MGQSGVNGIKWLVAELEEWAEPSGQIDNGYVGLMTVNSKDQSNFVYWIGILFRQEPKCRRGSPALIYRKAMSVFAGSTAVKNGEIYGEKTLTLLTRS